MDKPLNELDLSLVVCVVACPSRDSTTAFHFEVHFSVTKGSPWILQAQSQVCSFIVGVKMIRCLVRCA